MRTHLTRWSGAAALTALLAATTAQAQDKNVKPAVGQDDARAHQMVINNGALRTVHFFPGKDVSDSERNFYRERAAAENELALVDLLQQLRLQYVKNELSLLPGRRATQEMLYGYSTTYPGHWSPGGIANAPLYGGSLAGAYTPGFPYLGGGMAFTGLPYPGLTGGNVAGSLDAYASGPFSAGGVNTQNLSVGVGDEGILKRKMAEVLAKQATPEYAAKVRQVYNEVAAAKPGAITAAGYSEDSGYRRGDRVTLTVKVGDKLEKIQGTFVRESPTWMVLENADGGMTRIRMADIVMSASAKKAE
jgi:hypothetical protein